MRKLILATALTCLLGIWTGVAKADSAAPNCTISQIEYFDTGTESMLLVNCSGGAGYFAIVSGAPACRTVTADSAKELQSLATTARLAGKTVTIFYNPPAGSCTFSTMSGIQW